MPYQLTGPKKCKRCGEVKERSEHFYRQRKYYHPYCKPCSAIRAAEYRDANAEVLIQRRRADRLARPEHFRRIESERWESSIGVQLSRAARDTPCVDCGVRLPPSVMEFDHIRGEKLFTIGGIASKRKSEADIRAEIAKCDVRCPNCHKLRHHWERERLKAKRDE